MPAGTIELHGAQVVITMCCRTTELQQLLYMHFAASSATRTLIGSGQVKTARVLSSITALKKLCNHPKLIYDAVQSKQSKPPDGFEVRPATGHEKPSRGS